MLNRAHEDAATLRFGSISQDSLGKAAYSKGVRLRASPGEDDLTGTARAQGAGKDGACLFQGGKGSTPAGVQRVGIGAGPIR